MTPQEMAYGFTRTLPVAAMAAVATLIGLVFERNRRLPFGENVVTFFTIFTLWICIAFPFSFNVDGSMQMLSKVLKINFMILISLMLLHTRKHIELFVWVLVFSIGFFSVKGGVFTIATGGGYHVLGPGGFIGGNNELALAIVIVIPLMRFLQLQQKKIWAQHAFTVAMVLSGASVLGSQSRGALLAVASCALFLWAKSSKKLVFGVGVIICAIFLVAFMPESWDARMSTISTYQDDASAMGRINAWWMAWNLASHNFFGGGFDIYNAQNFAAYAPNPLDIHAAHSIYFQVLGEHGFIGLLLYLIMWCLLWKAAGDLIRDANRHTDFHWCRDLGAMSQVSLAGFLVGGAFLSLAYFDLPYDILVAVVLCKRWINSHEISRSARPMTRDGQSLSMPK